MGAVRPGGTKLGFLRNRLNGRSGTRPPEYADRDCLHRSFGDSCHVACRSDSLSRIQREYSARSAEFDSDVCRTRCRAGGRTTSAGPDAAKIRRSWYPITSGPLAYFVLRQQQRRINTRSEFPPLAPGEQHRRYRDNRTRQTARHGQS